MTGKGLKVICKHNKIEVYNDRLIATATRQPNHCFKMLFKILKIDRANVSTTETTEACQFGELHRFAFIQICNKAP